MRARVRCAAVIVTDEGILLARHKKRGRTYWVLPGGGLEEGETFAEGVRREVFEETALEVNVKDLLFVHQFFPKSGPDAVVDLIYHAEIVSGNLKMGADSNLAEIRFVPLEEFRTLDFLPPIRDQILNAVANGFHPERTDLGTSR